MIMKIRLSFGITLAAVLATCTARAQFDIVNWKKEALQRIHAPTFAAVVYNVKDSGAIADGRTDIKPLLDRLITLCNQTGGGEVRIPQGDYFMDGPVVLKSNVNLHLDTGARLIFSPNPAKYLPAVLCLWEGTELFNYCPLVYAYECTNVAITGRGELDGSASEGFARWRPQGSPEQNQLRQMGTDGTPVYRRVFGEGFHLPPDMIQFYGCNNVLIEGVTITDAPYWVIHPVLCNNVTVQHVTIRSLNLNNDGCDPECSTDVLIQDCDFTVGDDGIAIKAGRDRDGWRLAHPTEDVIIRNCTIRSKTNGVCIGSEMSAGVRNVWVDGVVIRRCLSAIYFKSNLDRGGFIKDVDVRRVHCDSARSAFIRFENNYHGSRGGDHPTNFSGFLIEHSTCDYSGEVGIYAVGVDGHPLQNITITDVTVGNTPQVQIIHNVEGLRYQGININGKPVPAPVITGIIRLHTD